MVLIGRAIVVNIDINILIIVMQLLTYIDEAENNNHVKKKTVIYNVFSFERQLPFIFTFQVTSITITILGNPKIRNLKIMVHLCKFVSTN